MSAEFLFELESLIKDRQANPVDGSYTNALLTAGVDRILKKVGEEAGEVIIAAKNQDKSELSHEIADLMYHLSVLLAEQGHSWSDIMAVLKQRHQ